MLLPPRAAITQRLHNVLDPELGINIVDLGLIYDVAIEDANVAIQLTLTYPGCPLAPVIIREIEHTLEGWKGIERVHVDIVWEPAWEQDMIEEDALEELRFAGRIR